MKKKIAALDDYAFKSLLAFLLRVFTGEYGNFLHFA